jgi:hypothetical protein
MERFVRQFTWKSGPRTRIGRMRPKAGDLIRRGLLTAALLLIAMPALAGRDVMLVLDNSGSMRGNDPARLATPAVLEFIKSQPRDTRVAIVLFSTSTELVLPLMPAEVAADGEAEAALKKFNYRGQWTQIPQGVERALYELRNEGRSDAQRSVVLMTDGWVDTGNAARDAELHQWLRGDLAAQAKKDGVRIFGIAFSERADYQLLQSLAATTGGEYFRVLNPDGISRAFKRIDSIMLDVAAPVAEPAPAPAESAAPSEAPAITTPAETAAPVAEPGSHWAWWLFTALALLVIGLALVYATRLFLKQTGAAAGDAAVAAKNDGGPLGVLYNNNERHELGGQTVVLGRAGGADPTRQYIVVPEKTVGRWHATIERRGQTFWVRDEGSVNGTFVNDERVIGEQPLKHRDTLRLHTHRYEFEIPELADSDRTHLSPKSRLSA